jgi:hypothetical protein
MAQVCGGTNFDFIAQRKHDAALRVLSRAADAWAVRGREAFTIDSVLAILLRLFLKERDKFTGFRWETRSLESWLPLVATPQREAEYFGPPGAKPHLPEVLTLLKAELSFAVDQWLIGDPEQPPTEHVLNAIVHVLFVYKLIVRPPSPKFPTSVIPK